MKEWIGVDFDVTCDKDYGMPELWDDRAISFDPNTGTPLTRSRRGHF